MIETVKAHEAELILFSNPNNPLGITRDMSELITLLDSVDAYVVIDEAYAEYHGESMVDLVAKYPKLLVMRTMSKGWGLARLRVGFLVANAALIQYLGAIRGPFIMSDLNANIAAAVLDHADLMHSAVAKTMAVREQFLAFLQAYKVKVHPSGANFVYVEVPDAKAIAAGVLEDGIALAVFGEHGLRITIGTEAQMADLAQSLAKHLPGIE
jgi:histidinol-phosphate aminotransferase